MEDISWGMILKTEIDARRPVYYSGGGLPGEAGHLSYVMAMMGLHIFILIGDGVAIITDISI